MTRVAEGWAVKHILDIAILWAVGARPSPGLTNTLGVTGGSAPTPRDPVFFLPAHTVHAMCALDCTCRCSQVLDPARMCGREQGRVYRRGKSDCVARMWHTRSSGYVVAGRSLPR